MKYDLLTLIFVGLFITISTHSFAELRLESTPIQSGLLRGHIDPEEKIIYADRQLKTTPDGTFIVGFGRDVEPQQTLIWIDSNG